MAQLFFILLFTVSLFFFIKKIKEIRRNINLGRRTDYAIKDKTWRFRNMLLLAVGQKKMFDKPIVGLLHLFIYIGFFIVNIELVEILLDGFLGTHRFFLSFFPIKLYQLLINAFEILAFITIIACLVFLVRRNFIPISRLKNTELNGFPKRDANTILLMEIILMSAFLTMNAADSYIQDIQTSTQYLASSTGNFWISQYLHPLFGNFSTTSIVFIERCCWWIHIVGIFVFVNYLVYSKHLHILLAFPTIYYARQSPLGQMSNMPEVQQEVLFALNPEMASNTANNTPTRFGAKDIFDLSTHNLLEAYSCTECGRCTEQCPAHITGKKLSPRAIMMKTRDRLEEVGRNINQNKKYVEDNKSLLDDYITKEELWACVTCNACSAACPIQIAPVDIIMQLRRYLLMEESQAPAEWHNMNTYIENNFSPWQLSPDDRDSYLEQ